MHEMSVAQSIVDIVLDTMKQHNVSDVRRVRIQLGELSGVIPYALTFGLDFLTKDTPLEETEFVYEKIPIKARCRNCKCEFIVKELEFICPECQKKELDTLSGTELKIIDMEVV
jgi:hydrogenase nickel incorporation protein HypA/HybF